MYRDDDLARSERANILIGEIAELERLKVMQRTTDQRLEDAKRELAAMHAPAPSPKRTAGLFVHVLVFGGAAMAAFAAYSLLV